MITKPDAADIDHARSLELIAHTVAMMGSPAAADDILKAVAPMSRDEQIVEWTP